MLDFDDAATPAVPVAQPPQHSHSQLVAGLELDASSSIAPAQFQDLWGALPDRYNDVFLRFSRLPASVSEIETILSRDKIFTVASGMLPGNTGMKFFFYASGQFASEAGVQILAQTILSIDGSLQLTVKSNFGVSIVDEFLALLAQSLSSYR